MKKLFAFVLIFALLLSGCGKTETPEISEPEEQIAELEQSVSNPEEESSETEVSSEDKEIITDKNDSSLSELYMDMLINFGAKVNESGELVVKKGVNFYYDVVGVSDYLLEDSIRFHSWAMSRSDIITKIEVSLPGFSDKVYAYPAEIFESEVFKYFGRTAESLRVPGFYYEEQNCYFLDGHGGIGETPFIVVNSIEENDNMVTFHITLDYEFDNDRDMALTVKLLPDGGYNYVSYLRE